MTANPADIVEQMIVERAAEALVEAKATIEAQQAEISELRRIAQARNEQGRELRAELMELRGALEKIVEGKEMTDPLDDHRSTIMVSLPLDEIEQIARTALQEAKDA